MKMRKSILWSIILALGIIAHLFVGCQNEETESVERVSGLQIAADFIKLSDDSTEVAGELIIQSSLSEVSLKWNTDSICNLDTTVTFLPVKNGRCSLPIKWKEKQESGKYGPDGIAYKAGVQVTAGEYSAYIPLIWAEKVDTTKIMESFVKTRAAGEPLPKVSQITMLPATVTMDDATGGTMKIGLSNVPYVIMDYSEITSDMNIDMTDMPNVITEDTSLNFKWKAGGAPSFGFSASIIAMSEGLTQVGIVQYLKSTPQITLSANPISLTLAGNPGAKGASVITTNDVQGWTASVVEGDWFTVTPSGTNGEKLEVTALSANTTGASRKGTITATSKSDPQRSVTISVTQAVMTVDISISANPVSMNLKSQSGSSASSIITTNDTQGWTAISNVSWLSVTPTGINGGALTVTATSASSAQRSGTVTVTSISDPSKTAIISVTQGGVINVKVMSIGGLPLAGGVKVGPVNSTGYPYINGLTSILNYNLGPNSTVPCVFSYYNYYCGGMSPSANESKDFANAVAMLRQYDIDIACLFSDWEAGPTIGQANELLAWVNEKPSRCIIFAFDYTNGNVGLTSALGLYDRKMGGGSSFSVASSSYNDPTFQSIMVNGPFGNLYGSKFNLVDGVYGNVSLQSCQSAGFVPLLQDSQGRIAAGINPSKRIVFHGESQFCQNGIVNTNGTLTPTAYGAYPQLIANIWAWMCNQVAAGK